jgi:hypothetical protein
MGILFVADNAGIGCAGWVLRAITSDIAEILKENGHVDLADWLTSNVSPVQLYSDLDVRDLTKENQKVFLEAVGPAYIRSKKRGPVDWNDPTVWDGYINLFGNLANQVELLTQGKVPTVLPNLNGVSEHDGTRDGPGWSNEIDA